MDILQAIFLGIVQGLTEFLPISSSGHLVIFQNLLGINEPEIFFDICLHMGTLFAILIVYFKEVIKLTSSFFTFKGIKNRPQKDFTLVIMIITGSIPTAIIGLIIKKHSEFIFQSTLLTGFMLAITGAILFSSKFVKQSDTEIRLSRDNIKKGIIIGIIQGFAVFPGISRSGSTIIAGLFLGLKRENAASFSFLLSIPAVFGAQLLSLKDVSLNYLNTNLYPVIFGTFASFIVGYGALLILLKLVNRGKLYFFAPYCTILGVLCIIFSIFLK